jgi:peptidoglycan/xylan/chitin deacetylase (PgdA/CDA1 family)
MWERRRCVAAPTTLCALAGALLLSPLSSARAQSTDQKAAPPICWAPQSLAAQPGEERISRTAASVEPSSRAPLRSKGEPPYKGQAIRRVKLPPGQKLVALTFDLCEQPNEIAGYQGATVDFLRANGIKATFFAGGKWLLTHKERSKQLMADPLFEVGNHAWEHRNLRLLENQALIDEVRKPQIAYEQVREELAKRQCLVRDGSRAAHEQAPERMTLFRFPFGACNDKALETVADIGLTAIQWDVSSGDPTPSIGGEAMARGVLAHVKPGSIVLFHANGRGWHTPEGLPLIVAELRKRGFGFVTVSELLQLGEPVAERICYDSHPGDTDRYDGFARRLELIYQRARQKARSSAAPLGGAEMPPTSVPIPTPARRPSGSSFKTEVHKDVQQ